MLRWAPYGAVAIVFTVSYIGRFRLWGCVLTDSLARRPSDRATDRHFVCAHKKTEEVDVRVSVDGGGVNHTRCWGTCAIYILSDNTLTHTHTAREEKADAYANCARDAHSLRCNEKRGAGRAASEYAYVFRKETSGCYVMCGACTLSAVCLRAYFRTLPWHKETKEDQPQARMHEMHPRTERATHTHTKQKKHAGIFTAKAGHARKRAHSTPGCEKVCRIIEQQKRISIRLF